MNFKHLDFGFVSDFEIRISCFKENGVALGVPPPDFTEILEYIYKFKTQLNYYITKKEFLSNRPGNDMANKLPDRSPDKPQPKRFSHRERRE